MQYLQQSPGQRTVWSASFSAGRLVDASQFTIPNDNWLAGGKTDRPAATAKLYPDRRTAPGRSARLKKDKVVSPILETSGVRSILVMPAPKQGFITCGCTAPVKFLTSKPCKYWPLCPPTLSPTLRSTTKPRAGYAYSTTGTINATMLDAAKYTALPTANCGSAPAGPQLAVGIFQVLVVEISVR